MDFLRQRLYRQRVGARPFKQPADVVRWLGAVQAQDYPSAKWALALRTERVTDRDIEESFNHGEILRTHVLRPTWHFVLPSDIRWMVTFTAPRVNAAMGSYYRAWRLDERLFAKSNKVIARALEGGKHLPRRTLAAALTKAGIVKKEDGPLRVVGLVLRAELDALICSGPMVGNQLTYALLEERVPRARILTDDEARAELVRRYFVSHGPATIADFRRWAGLTAAEATAGLEDVGRELDREVVGGKTFWFDGGERASRGRSATACLLPIYDECLLSYRDDPQPRVTAREKGAHTLGPAVVVDGRVVGTWKRMITEGSVVIDVTSFAPLTAKARHAVIDAAEGYAQFLQREPVIRLRGGRALAPAW
jgi:hypothetical protein